MRMSIHVKVVGLALAQGVTFRRGSPWGDSWGDNVPQAERNGGMPD